MSNNCVFGFPIYSDASPLYTPSVSGGSWRATLPASNVMDRRLHRVARSTSASGSHTQILFDLGVARPVGVLAVLIPNLTISNVPTVQWTAGTSLAAFDIYNSTALQALPSGLTIEDLVQPDGSLSNVWCVQTPTPFTARYLALLIKDTANVDGYVDVARVIIAGALQPLINTDVSDGAKHQRRDETVRTITPGGSALYTVRRSARSDTFSIDDCVASDAAAIRTMQLRLGKSGQVFWIPDPTDTAYAWQRNYLGVMEELGALTAHEGRTNGEFVIIEDL